MKDALVEVRPGDPRILPGLAKPDEYESTNHHKPGSNWAHRLHYKTVVPLAFMKLGIGDDTHRAPDRTQWDPTFRRRTTITLEPGSAIHGIDKVVRPGSDVDVRCYAA